LKELCTNPRVTNAEIGRRVGLSAPAVADRIEKLEDQGIINGYSTNVNLDKLGLTIKALITFRATKISYPELIKFFNSTSEIVEWNAITGNDCAMLRVAVSTGGELERLITKFREYGETSTTIILSTNKKLPIPMKLLTTKTSNGK
jgi:Lrp/AsnC family leucine-responsive transcriptional regulator